MKKLDESVYKYDPKKNGLSLVFQCKIHVYSLSSLVLYLVKN